MTDETAAQHCVACGQVKRPDDYWQRKISEAREDALEEAAKVCDEYAKGWVIPSQSPFAPVADRIRALALPPAIAAKLLKEPTK